MYLIRDDVLDVSQKAKQMLFILVIILNPAKIKKQIIKYKKVWLPILRNHLRYSEMVWDTAVIWSDIFIYSNIPPQVKTSEQSLLNSYVLMIWYSSVLSYNVDFMSYFSYILTKPASFIFIDD